MGAGDLHRLSCFGLLTFHRLDHVVAAKHLMFTKFGTYEVSVRGWPEQPTAGAQDAWIAAYSDHALLYFEVEEVP